MISITHHIPGRVRLKTSDFSQYFEMISFFSEKEEVKISRENPGSKSVVLFYSSSLSYQEIILKYVHLHSGNSKKIGIDETRNRDEDTSLLPLMLSGGTLILSLLLPAPFRGIVTWVAVSPVLLNGVKEFASNGINSHFMESTAVLISLLRKEFFTANITNILLQTSEYMEDSLNRKSESMLQDLLHKPIEFVWVEKDGQITREEYNNVSTGDIVVVGAGDMVPVDGTVLSGQAEVNESSMTGESLPVKKIRGDRVLSGTALTDGSLRFFAEVVGENTAMLRVSRYVASALNEKTSIESTTGRFADSMVPLTIGLSGLSYLITGKLSSVASVLQADYSCVFRISVPVAIRSSIYEAGTRGILFKDGIALEKFADVDTVVLDKTGTLTHGKLAIDDILLSPEADMTEDEFLHLTASIEEHYFHPIAEAIVVAAREREFTHFNHGDVEFLAGHGVSSMIGKDRITIGSLHYLKDHENISFESMDSMIRDPGSNYVLLYIGYNKKPLGIIVLKDTLREEAAETLQALRDIGISRIVLLSGDRQDRAEEMGRLLNLDEYYGELEPEGKAKIIERLKNEGRSIAYVGDGINDAPSLTKADVGISMGNAADITHATSDIILLKDDLYSLVRAREIATNAMDVINKNYKISVGANSAIILGAMGGWINPFTSAFLHNGSTMGVVLHSYLGTRKQQ